MTYLRITLMFFIIIFLIITHTFSFAESNDKCNLNLGEWLKCNNPRVINFLQNLSDADIGKVVDGVSLTDGRIEMQNYIFLGEAKNIGRGIHLYIFEYEGQRSAYVWIDQGGAELHIPQCPKDVAFENAYVLSWDVYTWNAVQPGNGLVHIMCIEDTWLKQLKNSED